MSHSCGWEIEVLHSWTFYHAAGQIFPRINRSEQGRPGITPQRGAVAAVFLWPPNAPLPPHRSFKAFGNFFFCICGGLPVSLSKSKVISLEIDTLDPFPFCAGP